LGPDGRQKLAVNVCGPTKVTPGTSYSYTVVLANIKATSFRTVKLSVIHYDPITRSSLPYSRRVYMPDPLMSVAVFKTIRDFKPGRTFRVSFRLPFKKHNDPKGSNFMVEARGYGPRAVSGRTYDVWWKSTN
jgi:hypothetical protein